MGWREALRHGLAMDPEPPDPELEAFMDAISTEIVRRRLGPLAVMMLASGMPLSFLFSQFMVFAEPLIQALFPLRNYKRFISLLEDRTQLERFLQKIEAREEDYKAGRLPPEKSKPEAPPQ